MQEKFSLKITSAVVVDGEIRKAGTIVEVSEQAAKDLLRRGKAEPAADQPAPQADPEPAAEQPKGGKKKTEQPQDGSEPAAEQSNTKDA